MSRGIGHAGAAFHRAASYVGYALDLVAPMLPRLGSGGVPRQVRLDGLTIRMYRDVPGDPTFAFDCEQLYRRSPDATPFHSLAWQHALLETAAATRTLRLFTVYDTDRLVAVLPLEVRWGRILRSTGRLLTDYLDPLIDPEYGPECWGAILTGIRKLSPGRSIVIENVRDDSIACRGIQSTHAQASGFQPLLEADGTVSRVPLPASWDAYLAALDGHDRRELKRRIRKAEEGAGARLEFSQDPATILDQIDGMLRIINLHGGGKSLKAKWLFPRHFGRCARKLAESGRLAICTLMMKDKPAARAIQLPTSAGLIGWNTTFDPSMREWSPGIVLLGMIIRHSIQKGYRVHDMLRGQNDYKYRLGAKDFPLRKLTLRAA